MLRDQEQARLTDHAYAEAVRLIEKHRAALPYFERAREKLEVVVPITLLLNSLNRSIGMPDEISVEAELGPGVAASLARTACSGMDCLALFARLGCMKGPYALSGVTL